MLMLNGSPLVIGGGNLKPRVPPTAPDMVLVAHGDSITNSQNRYVGGTGACCEILAGLIHANRGLNVKVIRRGLTGNSFNFTFGNSSFVKHTLLEDGPWVDAYLQQDAPHWLKIHAGSNGLALQHNSAAVELAYHQTYLEARIAAGQDPTKILIGTMLPRGGGGTGERVDYNAGLAALAAAYGCKIARYDLNATIGPDAAADDVSLYPDAVHPSDAAVAIMAQIDFDAMFPA